MADDLNPYVLLADAASGGPDGLRRMAVEACRQGVEGGDLIAIAEALLLARLVYAGTGKSDDAGALLSYLGLAIACFPEEQTMRFAWSAEAVALTSRLADAGDAIAEQHLSKLVEEAGADATAVAKDIIKMMEGAD